MASYQILNQRKAQAMAEAVQTTERLLGGESERLHSAQKDVVGKTMQDYVFSMLISELTRVVDAQQERIEALEETLARSSETGKIKATTK